MVGYLKWLLVDSGGRLRSKERRTSANWLNWQFKQSNGLIEVLKEGMKSSVGVAKSTGIR